MSSPADRRRGIRVDDHTAGNVRVYRDRAGLSQADVARLMADRGWPYHAQTVYRVEQGQRNLLFGEAVDLASIFGIPVHLLSLPRAEMQATDEMYAVRRGVLLAHEAVVDAVFSLRNAVSVVEHRARLFAGSQSPRVREATQDALAAISEYDLDSAVAEGVRRFEDRGK